jgi:hypothetical protein
MVSSWTRLSRLLTFSSLSSIACPLVAMDGGERQEDETYKLVIPPSKGLMDISLSL